MKKFEYKVFNFSEGAGGKWLPALAAHGADGWQVLFQLNKGSFLMMREV